MFNHMKKTHLQTNAANYEDFIQKNRVRTNNALNTVMWFCIIAGPAIAIFVTAGVFKHISYLTCIMLSVILIVCSTFHKFLCRKFPKSGITSIFALAVMDFLLVYLVRNHVGITLCYFMVPFVSLLFCDKRTYYISSIINYFVMILGVYVASTYATECTVHSDQMIYFWDKTAGLTIEATIMFIVGHVISMTTTEYLKRLYDNQNLLVQNENTMKGQLEILNSMSDIYSQMIILDFNKNQIVSFDINSKKPETSQLKTFQHHTELSQMLSQQIVNDQLQEFLRFTNISTIRRRMINNKLLSAEFISTVTGWLRVQFIAIDHDIDTPPRRIIQTIQDIDQEKQEEENLKLISNTDQLTHLYNRRAYDDAVQEYQSKPIESDFVLVSIDVNGLKVVNDNLGHAAGDELILGAAFSMRSVFGHIGKIYRVGGDEFLIICHTTEDFEQFKNQLQKIVGNWHGQIAESLAVSIGYAKKSDYPSASINDLEKTADDFMYKDKEAYYLKKGVDRRGQQLAYGIICSTYTKIIKLYVNEDTFSPIQVSENEKTNKSGYSDSYSTWIKNAVQENIIHKNDAEMFLKKCSREYITDYFLTESKSYNFIYRRKIGSAYKKVLLEIAKADDYTAEAPVVYIYVKAID